MMPMAYGTTKKIKQQQKTEELLVQKAERPLRDWPEQNFDYYTGGQRDQGLQPSSFLHQQGKRVCCLPLGVSASSSLHPEGVNTGQISANVCKVCGQC